MVERTKAQVSPVAVSAEARAILKRLVKTLGVPQLALLDQIIKAADQYVEHHGGRMIVPLKFTEQFRVVTIEAGNQPVFQSLVLEEPPRRGKSKAPVLAHG